MLGEPRVNGLDAIEKQIGSDGGDGDNQAEERESIPAVTGEKAAETCQRAGG